MGKEIEGLDDTEGRVIEAEYENFILVSTCNTYTFYIYLQFFLIIQYKFNVLDVPNSGAGLKTLPKRLKWDEAFRNYLKGLDANKPVVLTGDLNVAHEEIGIAEYI